MAQPNGAFAATQKLTERHGFQNVPPTRHIERMQRHRKEQGTLGIALSELWLGLAASHDEDHNVDIGFACHDGTYTIDFAVQKLKVQRKNVQDKQSRTCETELPQNGELDGPSRTTALPTDPEGQATEIANYIVSAVKKYETEHQYKFLGVGISSEIVDLSPQAPARIWMELDIIPVMIRDEEGGSMSSGKKVDAIRAVDELADSMARKCLSVFGPSKQPRVQVGFDNRVEVDLDGRATLTTIEQYQDDVSERTWKTAVKYAESLKQNKKKFAFFSATPQGGGVALMRHAEIRFWRLMGVDAQWFVPKPKPEIFRVTKTNHNILQGVADPKERLTTEQQQLIHDWIANNAERYWTKPGGPLSARSKGGVDAVFIDDPQMPDLINIAKREDPERPVVFRSHIQIRSDLAEKPDTPTAGVWQWLWDRAQHADLFISHPVKEFVPKSVPKKRLGYMPATTDWFDGLNKPLSDFDTAYYLHEFNTEAARQSIAQLAYPKRDYIVQIARFDPSKGIPDVLDSYARFRRNSQYCKGKKPEETPQLVIAGHGSVDDPDGVAVLDQTIELLETKYSDIRESVIAIRLGPIDQLLNALMSNARVALQLSTREGFEVKVSEGLHKGVPMIVSNAGGIPLQVQHGKSGFVVESGDNEAVARYLDLLFGDERRWKEMSEYAATHVSDEVGTLGNAICWMYLADKYSSGKKVEPDGRWVWDLAREEAGLPKGEGENWLPRSLTT